MMIKSIIAAIGTFSVIPMPTVNLEDKHIKHTLIFFPTVGIIVGILEVLWYIICGVFSLPALVFALIAALIPIAVTGGIHLDGCMDCMDGIHSYTGLEESLKILKDPHIGAFCVIKLAELGLVYLAFAYLLAPGADFAFHFGGKATLLRYGIFDAALSRAIMYAVRFAACRALSGFSLFTFESAKKDGMGHAEKSTAVPSTGPLLLTFFFVWAVISVILAGAFALIPFAGALLCMAYYKGKVKKDFGGVTGDTSGCFLVMAETFWLILTALISLIW